MESHERLKAIIDWAGMSTHAFAMKIGMRRSENLYRIIKNKENVSIKLATLILDTYSQINKDWLFYGDDEMFVEDVNYFKECDMIPYYSILPENVAGVINKDKHTFDMYIPIFKGTNFAVTMNDRAMEPIIPFGSILVLKEQLSNILLYGNTYYIVTEEIIMVRIIRKSEISDNEIILKSHNNKYDDLVIPKKQIKKMYLVCGTINRFF